MRWPAAGAGVILARPARLKLPRLGSMIMGVTDEEWLFSVARRLSEIAGVGAIVLGGSRATGTSAPHSDYDLGLYYEADNPLDTASLTTMVRTLDDAGPAAVVTPIGGWGPWINGGGWLTIDGKRVDLLYRDLRRVRAVIAQCRRGHVERHYQPGHPHAFVSSIYPGEVACGKPLWDPRGVMPRLKRRTLPYPEPLRQGLTRIFLWEARFAMENARHGRALEDVTYALGCCFRAVACLCQVLFAVNRTYLLNEKGAVLGTQRLPFCPSDFSARVTSSLRAAGSGDTASAVEALNALVAGTEALAASSP